MQYNTKYTYVSTSNNSCKTQAGTQTCTPFREGGGAGDPTRLIDAYVAKRAEIVIINRSKK